MHSKCHLNSLMAHKLWLTVISKKIFSEMDIMCNDDQVYKLVNKAA